MNPTEMKCVTNVATTIFQPKNTAASFSREP
jgi:hypothetical protein